MTPSASALPQMIPRYKRSVVAPRPDRADPNHLVSLRMPRALAALDPVVQQLERGQATAIEAIETLLAEELTIRESRRIKAALQIARLMPITTLSGFDFSFHPRLAIPPAAPAKP